MIVRVITIQGKYPVKPIFPFYKAPGILILRKYEEYSMNTSTNTLAADFRRSGKTQKDYCTKNNISIHTLRYYLYKKPRRKSSTVSQPVQPSSTAAALPSFISFNREAPPENTSRQPFTVIHGFFSMTELAKLISMATRQ